MPRFEGQVAVVTGGSSGIGLETAELLLVGGATVMVVARTAARLERALTRLRATGGDVDGWSADVSDNESSARLFDNVATRHGRLDVLVNCAGGSVSTDGLVDQIPPAELGGYMMSEVSPTIHCAHHAVPLMRSAGGGAIVNLSSFSAQRGTVGIHGYVAGKGAIEALTRSWAGSYAQDGIRVNAVAPGVALTERARERISESNVSAQLSFEWRTYPFAQGEPRDIANVIAFLASADSRMITGQVVLADGGLTAY